MKYGGILLAVKDLETSIAFYEKLFELKLVHDFGANIAFDNGLSLQTLDSWSTFLQHQPVTFQGNDAELYFEEDNFDDFLKKLHALPDIHYVHDVIEHRWGQRAIRIYDPDMHIIEIAENISSVCQRFLDTGLSIEETAKRMDVSIAYVKDCTKAA